MIQDFQFVPIQSIDQLSDLDLDYFLKLSSAKRPEQLQVAEVNGFMQGLVEFESQKRAHSHSEWSDWSDGWVL